MRLLNRTPFSPIGLDLGTHAFKAVQLKRAGRGWKAEVAVSLARPTPDAPIDAAEMARFAGVLDRRGFVGRDVVVAVPTAHLVSAVLELPARAPGVPVEQLAAVEFARVSRVEPGRLTSSMWELPATSRASRATFMLAVGVRTDALDAHLDGIESSGLNVIAVDEPFTATARGGRFAAPGESGLTAVIDFGWHAVTLAILKNDTVVYTRSLADAGLARLFKAVVDQTECEPADVRQQIWQFGINADAGTSEAVDAFNAHVAAMLREIGQAMDYAAHQYPDAPTNAVLLVGGGASVPGLDSSFAETLGVPVRVAAAAGTDAVMTQALGLALWAEGRR